MFKLLQQLKVQLTIVVLLVFVLNWNTFSNEYALDDDIVIHQNLNVQAGVSGIGEILSTDAFQGFLDSQGAEIWQGPQSCGPAAQRGGAG